jgi:hypothetical protein
MRAIAFVVLVAASTLVACGAQPNQPVLANVPKPNPSAVAGGAAAAAAAITLASPDSHKPERREEQPKKPIKVKENVPASVLDRLDDAESKQDGSAQQPEPEPTAPKPPRDAFDFD